MIELVSVIPFVVVIIGLLIAQAWQIRNLRRRLEANDDRWVAHDREWDTAYVSICYAVKQNCRAGSALIQRVEALETMRRARTAKRR